MPASESFSSPEVASVFRRRVVLGVLASGVALGVWLLDFFGFNPLWRAELAAEDFRMRSAPAPVDERIVFLAVDEQNYHELLPSEKIAASPMLARMGPWPWHREVHAGIIERLAGAGARAIVFDFFFVNPAAGDDEFAGAIARHRDRVVLAAMPARAQVGGTEPERLFVPSPLFTDAVAELAATNAGGCVGLALFDGDADGQVRHARLRPTFAGVDAESLAARALRKAGYLTTPASTEPLRIRFAGEPGGNYRPIPIYQLFAPETWDGEFGGGRFFRDRIVFIGPFGEWAKDFVPGPYSTRLAGPEAHLAVMGAALNNGFLREPGPALKALCIFFCGGVVWLLSLGKIDPLRLLLIVLAMMLLWLGSAFVLFDRAGWIVPVVPPLLALLGAGTAVFTHDFRSARRERAQISRMFSTMVSPEVLAYMREDPSRFQLRGERREATIFFSDLAGFTTISESLAPEELALVLNRYLTPMSDILMRHGGYIDKYAGDAIMADFGVPVWKDSGEPASHAWHACWAALEQLEELGRLRPRIQAEFGCDIDLRIGINTGTVVAGNMGSAQKFQYTVMGDTVNQAARFEPACKLFGTRILVGESTIQLAREKVEARLVAALIVKGRTAAVRCYELLAKKGGLPEVKRQIVARFEKGWQLHAVRRFDDAIAEFDRCLQLDPLDGPSLSYRRMCERYLQQPPPAGWQGEWVQLTK